MMMPSVGLEPATFADTALTTGPPGHVMKKNFWQIFEEWSICSDSHIPQK